MPRRQPVRIETIDTRKGGDFRAVKTIDWFDSSDRRWLKNHTHWAMMNGVSITQTPESI